MSDPEQSQAARQKTRRLHFLDWLQVLAVMGVFIFHAVEPFDNLVEWNIKNVERSLLANLYSFFFTPWGMAFFFAMAGTTSWFSLRRRSPGRYIRERVFQLVIPFILGSLILTPIQAYYQLIHLGWWQGGSFVEFLFNTEARTYFYTNTHRLTASPEVFSHLGYHLWFLAFLFFFSLLALPVFMWLKSDSGRRLVAWLAGLTKWRGGLLMFTIPLIMVRFILQPYFQAYTGWSDFFFLLVFFISGFILIADEQFMVAVRRDWLLYLVLGFACAFFFFSGVAGVPVLTWMGASGTPGFYVAWMVFSINAWCWTMIMFYIGMRFLDFTNQWLQYGREASFAFFWAHHAVIYVIAFYVVLWEVNLTIKMLFVLIGSFVCTLGLYELLVRRINPVRSLFGMKPRRTTPATPVQVS